MSEYQNTRREEFRRRCESIDDRTRHSHVWTGLFILLIGVAALVKVSNPELPDWFFSWKTFLVALGIFIGIKHRFRGPAWFILILVGGAFLFTDIYPEISIKRYIWPVALIAVGVFFIFRPRGRHRWRMPDGQKKNDDTGFQFQVTAGIDDAKLADETYDTKEDYVDSTSIFGGAKKNIISKNFKGGDLVNIFGGTELDLTRADFTGTAILELTTIFGGTKLVVPSNWTIRSEAVTIFGGLEDKRNVQNITDNPEKLLVLRGTVIFGGIEIKSF